MGIVDSIVRIADFVLQGVLFLAVVWYALHGIPSFDQWFTDKRDRFLGLKRSSPDSNSTAAFIFTETALITVVVGGAYAIGLATNSLSLAIIEPAHEYIIQDVRHGRTFNIPLSWRLVLSPVRRGVSRSEEIAYVESLCEELAWKGQRRELAQGELEPLVKQLRVLRGAMMCFLSLALVCFAKFCVQFARWLGGLHARSSRWWLLIIYSLCSFAFYVGSMQAWTFVEADYHLSVYLGLRTTSSATSTSNTGSQPSSMTAGPPWDTTCASLAAGE